MPALNRRDDRRSLAPRSNNALIRSNSSPASRQAYAGDASHLTTDAPMLLVEAQLTPAGGARACMRAEVEQAFNVLNEPDRRKSRLGWMRAAAPL